MHFERLSQAVEYSKAYKRKKLRRRIVSGLAAIVVFVTTYALILPAITQERPTFCGFEEHIHNDECLSQNCGHTEHIHSGTCYVNAATDFETSSDWEATLPKVLTGIWSDDILSVAESQLGYRESSNNVVSAESSDSQTASNGYTRYGQWYGTPYGEWSSVFANFCLNFAGVDKDYFPYDADCEVWTDALREKKLLKDVPAAGDILFFRDGAKVDNNKTAIVADLIYDGEKLVRIKAIEGDNQNRVAYAEYSVTDERLYGYGDLSNAFEEYAKYQPIIKLYSDGSVAVKASFLPAAGIPKEAELVVKTLSRETAPEEFEASYNQAYKALETANGQVKNTEITAFRLYDIHFIHNGEELQPEESVDIQISYPVTVYSKTAEVSVFHYSSTGTEMPEIEHSLDDEGNLVTDFKTDSFSLFAIVTSETSSKSIVSLTKQDITSTNIENLDSTYAIVSGNYALNTDGTSLITATVALQSNSVLTADESSVRWTFEMANNGYYINTVIDGTVYYLNENDGTLSLNTETKTLFSATQSDTGLTLKHSGRSLTLSENGATAADTSSELSLYIIPEGEFTVIFDGQIGNAQYMSSNNHKYGDAEKITESTQNGYITLPTPEDTVVPGNYPLKLNGWYDIVNSVYYDSSMFGAQIKITCDTTFYPEWIPETYDIGQNSNVVSNQPDTSDFINTYVYDYNELFNVHSSYYNESDGLWYFDPDSELGFIFFDYITPYGNIGNILNKDTAVDGITVNAEKTNGSRGDTLNFPGTITSGIATAERINALFGDEPILGRVSVGEGDWLYSYDDTTGYYYYNSAKNAASYNQSEERFYVYENHVKIDNANSLHDFLPFNYAEYTGEEIKFAEKDNGANYWFGMKSEITFYLPDETGIGGNKTSYGDDMQFRFSGDDDVWIFIDGELVLDLGGVHDVVYGEINFSTGVVRTGQAKASDDIAANSAATREEMPGLTGTTGITSSTMATLEGGREHTLTVYYLERGSSLSNCAVYFNLSPLYQLALTKKDAEGENLLAGATFRMFSDKECTTPAVLYEYDENGALKALPDATFTTDENGFATCWGLFAGRTYYIKETKAPPGYSDMSKYVIEFTLSGDGQSVFIMIDSNGTEWEFAGRYVYTGGDEHLIELHVYNEKYIGGDGKLYVEKAWDEKSESIPDEITVRLYANGEKTSRTLTLSAENGWKASFLELPETDENGNEIVYTVKEEGVYGYADSYEAVQGSETIETVIPAHWESLSTASLTDGNTYRFTTGTKALAISGTTLTLADISDDDLNQRWLVSGSGTSWSFRNIGTGRYIYLQRRSVSTSATGRTVYYSNGVFGYSSSYYLYHNGSSFGINQRSSTAFSVDLWVEEESSSETSYYPGWKITNTPLTEISIPVEKLWDATVYENEKTEVSIDLYLVTIGSEDAPVFKETLLLNSENGWKSSFENLPYPEDGSYYAIIENTDDFTASYSGETVMITVDNQQKTAHRIEIDSGGTAVTPTVTNSALLLLPETGGSGVITYIFLGVPLLLIPCAVCFNSKNKRKIKEVKS